MISRNINFPLCVMLLAGVIGIFARLTVAKVGYNPDTLSWWIVANLTTEGQNVYASTEHYNYGPFWFNFLHLVRLTSNNLYQFHYLIALTLTIVDLAIFIIIQKKSSVAAACMFFLNPISIIVTGYHCQFDNLAILMGMLSVFVFGDNFEESMNNKKYGGLLLLGISISIKHVLFLFPLWLAIKQKGVLNKIAIITIPVFIFLLGFIPYWSEGSVGIINNVFLYKSFPQNIFYNLFIPKFIQFYLSSFTLWILALISCGFYLKKMDGFKSLLLYLVILVITAPPMANQYLAIALPYAVMNMNLFFILYTLVGTWHLSVDTYGLHINYEAFSNQPLYYNVLISLLFFGLIGNFLLDKLKHILKIIITAVKEQFV